MLQLPAGSAAKLSNDNIAIANQINIKANMGGGLWVVRRWISSDGGYRVLTVRDM